MRTFKRTWFLYTFFAFIVLTQVKAQVAIGTEEEPDIDAILELVSNETKGLLLPRLELQSLFDPDPMSGHKEGMVVYNTGDILPKGYYYNNGAQWVQITDTNIASWRSISTKDAATSNTDDIYQTGAVVVGASDLEDKTQFSVVSTTKGVLLPRMTTLQREAIQPLASIPDGLMIYNIDTHCYNYFNSSAGTEGKWVSLCGTQDPATFSLSDCAGTILPDPTTSPESYKVGVPLTSANTYTINVRVDQAGTYSIVLTTTNGYSFSKSGVFTEAGVTTAIVLEGQGVPIRESAGDVPTLQFNGQTVTPECTSPNALPTIPVIGTDARYSFDNCASIVYGPGEYERGQVVNSQIHYVEIDVTVIQNGTTTFEATPVASSNGLTFRSDPIDISTTSSPVTVRLFASGTPTNNGTYSYTIGNCTFNITASSNSGSFENPAKSCLALYNEGFTTDGEYWIQQRSGSRNAVKTFCDMTNGGYTLVWSFSERSVRERYFNSAPNGMSMWNSGLYLSADRPMNVVSTEAGTIDYFNYRLAGATMQNIKQNASSPSEYRVRIAYDPDNVNDAWGLENYMHLKPVSAQYDLLASTRGNEYTYEAGRYVPTTGKLFGLDYNQSTPGTTVMYAGTPAYGASAFYFARTTYVNHWDVGFRLLPNQNIPATVTNHNNQQITINVNPIHFDNLFTAINEEEIDHHIGKCVPTSTTDPTTVNDYSDANIRCVHTLKFPHSFNPNPSDGQFEGRVIQWWVK